MLSIKSAYVKTFFDTRTGWESLTERFFSQTTDELKVGIFTKNKNMWRARIGEDVKRWLNASLPSWLEEQPLWLTDYVKSHIPDWAVDDKRMLANLRNDEVKALVQERRASLVSRLTVIPKE